MSEPSETEIYVTYCPDCHAQYGPDEDGYDWEECIECGEGNCFEIPG